MSAFLEHASFQRFLLKGQLSPLAFIDVILSDMFLEYGGCLVEVERDYSTVYF